MNLNSSDIVAIVAVVVSTFVSVISAYIAYKNKKAELEASQQNNKSNILSKRTEFIFEKQITVFKEMALKMDEVIVFVANGIEQHEANSSNENIEEEFFCKLEKEVKSLNWFFNGEKFYLPKKILLSSGKFINILKDFVREHDYKNINKLLEDLVGENSDVTVLMIDYWGIDE